MKINPLRSLNGEHGSLRRNHPVDVPDGYAKALIERQLAVPFVSGEEAAGKASANPKKQGRSGGRNGKQAKRSSSSQVDPAQVK